MNRLLLVLAALLAGTAASPAQSGAFRVDFAGAAGRIRPLHGINKGPLAAGGMIDVSAPLRELAPRLTRLHDCQWPYPEVVDIHSIFRNPGADPKLPESYDWSLTDAYLAAVAGMGAGIVYRLGESIEHGTVKRFVHPPADPARWAQVCVGIARHYNEGWARGTNLHIRYWEIWNEPENRPAMWSGTDEDYLTLYAAAARALKAHDPQLKIGGPALGYSGELKDGQFKPSEFLRKFLDRCRGESLPLDFFSWHCYTADPRELPLRARGIRRVLNEYGFTKAESHLNEWNYLPGSTWEPFSKNAAPEVREKFYREMGGAAGAAFAALALIELQDAPVDVCNFYHGELGGFGLFNEFGVPNHVYYGLRAFSRVAALPARARALGGAAGKTGVLAGRDEKAGIARVLITNFSAEQTDWTLEVRGLNGPVQYGMSLVDAEHRWEEQRSNPQWEPSAAIHFRLPAPGVALFEFR